MCGDEDDVTVRFWSPRKKTIIITRAIWMELGNLFNLPSRGCWTSEPLRLHP